MESNYFGQYKCFYLMRPIQSILLFVCFSLLLRLAHAQPCSLTQALSPLQINQLSILSGQLDSLLDIEQFSGIDSISEIIQETYADQGGIPDEMEEYYSLVDITEWPDLTGALMLSRQLIAADSAVYADLWRVAKGMAPLDYQPHSIYLRASAEVAVGLLKIADRETDVERSMLYRAWATQALDSLATMQLPSGAFPFPDLRPYGDPVFSPIIQNYLNSLGADSTEVLVNGWIIDDRNTGQFKFDAGVIGNAFYEAFVHTGDSSYRSIALSVADYMMPLKMNSNYNYNTFVSLSLTRGYQLTGNIDYLNRALVNIRYGVYPGVLPEGRWVDGHNAKSPYHALMLQNIIPTLLALPDNAEFNSELNAMTVGAIQNLIAYSENCGTATGFRWLTAAASLDSTLFDNSTWQQIIELLGRHMNQAALNGKYLDVQSMGAYLELLDELQLGVDSDDFLSAECSVFPNPFDDELTIVIGLSERQPIELVLMDNLGRPMCIIDSGEKNAGSYLLSWSGSSLAPGLYTWVMKTPSGQMIKRVVKR
jgi:hypothetical protein